ncbi:hypothetical protein EPH_0047010 [Eimeria praecox]|uniref:Uncharacterized protein n=1 Tax=Eimeria praecox TaxID=51316 RepID=U6GA80_9EIME|nr:hypothetical protein EPH_0047010 [Eimeria praecox]
MFMAVYAYNIYIIGVYYYHRQGQGSDIDASFEETDERAIAIATGVIDPRTGAPRNTALSPAECALIRDCQEKAFCGLEAKQLRAEAAAKIEETKTKLVADKPVQETEEAVSSKGTETPKTERHTQKATGVTVRIATRPPVAVAASVAAASAAPTQKEKTNNQAASPPAAVLNAFDSFAAPATVSSSSKEAAPAAAVESNEGLKRAKQLLQGMKDQTAVESNEGLKRAKQLLQGMKDQSFKLSNAVRAFAAAAKGATPEAAVAAADTATAAETPRDRGSGGIEIPETETGHSARQRHSSNSSSLLQFASATKELHTKVPLKRPAATAGRKDVITKTRFAHRTKLISATERSAPFIALKSSAAAAAAAETAAASDTADAGDSGETAVATATVDGVSLTQGVSGLEPINKAETWGVCTAEGPPLKRREQSQQQQLTVFP